MPVGARPRHRAFTLTVGAYPEDLVNRESTRFERVRRCHHVEPPHSRPRFSHSLDRLLPRVLEVRYPSTERLGIVPTKRLHVPHLEPGTLHGEDDVPDVNQLAI